MSDREITQLPSDAAISDAAMKRGNNGAYLCGFNEGAKWMRATAAQRMEQSERPAKGACCANTAIETAFSVVQQVMDQDAEGSEDNEKAPANAEASSRSVSPGNPRPSEVDYSTSAGTIQRLEEENKALRRVIDGESGACRLCGHGPSEHGPGTVNSLHKFVQREGRADLALALSAAKTELAALKKRNGELYRCLNSAETETEQAKDTPSCGEPGDAVTAYCFEIDPDGEMGLRDFARGLEELFLQDRKGVYIRLRMTPATTCNVHDLTAYDEEEMAEPFQPPL